MQILKGLYFSLLCRQRFDRAIGLAILLSFSVCSASALADGLDPFDNVDQSQWMSFQHYSDDAQKPRIEEKKLPADITEIEMVPNQDKDTKSATGPTTPATSVVIDPAHSLNLPALPGVKKDYSDQARSTADDGDEASIQLSGPNDQPTMKLESTNWQDAAEVARSRAKAQAAKESPDHMPLNVRFAFLPNKQIMPTEPTTRIATHGRGPLPTQSTVAMSSPTNNSTSTSHAAVDKTKSAGPSLASNTAVSASQPKQANAAACAAISTYKKRQLEAIESDRKTLAALQNAIADLGLQKQLSFVTDANGNINPQMDYPQTASTLTRKN